VNRKKLIINILISIALWAIGVGIGSQAIGFLAVKKTHQKLDDIDKN